MAAEVQRIPVGIAEWRRHRGRFKMRSRNPMPSVTETTPTYSRLDSTLDYTAAEWQLLGLHDPSPTGAGLLP